MKFNIDSLDRSFVIEYNRLQNAYPERLSELNGFGDKQLNYTDFIDNFVDKQTIADASIDGNANVAHKDIVSLINEMSKPHSKLLAFNKIFHELTKKYGHEDATEWLKGEWDGHFYLHDAHSSSWVPYCFAYDIDELVKRGLYFIDNFNAAPPQHLNTYTDFVSEFVSWTCNRSSGAVGLPSFLVYSYYFWKKDCDEGYFVKSPEYYRDQSFQEIIYRLNQPYLRGGIQSAFTNFSIFDKPYLEALFGGKEFPDGTFIIDYIDEIKEYQKAFMKVLSDTRRENLMTFPVVSFALLRQNGKFVDEDFAKWCCRHNMKWADSNIFVSEDVTSLSNCCFAGSQKVLARSSTGGAALTSFKELCDARYTDARRNLVIFHNGNWRKGKAIKLPARPLYKVTTVNNKELIITDNHITPTLRGDIKTTDLTTDDYILFNTKALNAPHETDKHLTYEQGYMIGMYLGDGSMSGEDATNKSTTICLSLNKEKYESSIKELDIAAKEIGDAQVRLGKIYNNVYPITIISNKVAEFIREYVGGKYCYEKTLNMNVLLQSIEFRRGILDGYYVTDGGNSNRIYSTSKELIDNIEALCTSLGFNTIVNVSDRTGEGAVVIRGEEFNRNYPLYCIRWYETYKRASKDIYKWNNNSVYFKVKSIEPINTDDEFCYCFEMSDEDEPYFTLPNGIITHNCRLKSNIKELGYFNSIGGSALEVGSIKVNTINLARLAYETTSEEEYLEALKGRVITCAKTLDVIRDIMKRNTEKGLLPNYALGIINMKSQYNTVGIIGVYEALQKFGYTYHDEFGNTYYKDEGVEFAKKILATITEIKDEFVKDKDYMMNIEQVPGERAAAVLMEKDKLFFPDEKYDLPLYGNQWIPLGIKTTIAEKVRVSAILDKACSGGSIVHINISSPFNSFDEAWYMMNYVADAGVNYFAFNLRISACDNNHGFFGDTCPECGHPVETTYQRIVGFLTPTKTYSEARKKEFAMRDWFDLNNIGEL